MRLCAVPSHDSESQDFAKLDRRSRSYMVARTVAARWGLGAGLAPSAGLPRPSDVCLVSISIRYADLLYAQSLIYGIFLPSRHIEDRLNQIL
jgi:hypothetical protein